MKANREQAAQKFKLERKLDLEISTRLQRFEKDLSRVFDPLWDLAKYDSAAESRTRFALYALDGQSAFESDNRVTYVFVDFKDRSFRSLLLELSGIVEKSEIKEISASLNAVSELERILEERSVAHNETELKKNLTVILSFAKQSFGLSRWEWGKYGT